ncbi:hypothetical protein [Paenibacillus contaminans]|uniref:Uncharacterized protein n=1 Tax=Paenibacillus contaminans TaxID=450362 RepID=A0A329LX78_9BACL|nr:hypothetical protein [Paenibacillus contaminans]RAV11736.1 hypothetical protein DQG23_35825 [Paenibacillus contaminans]
MIKSKKALLFLISFVVIGVALIAAIYYSSDRRTLDEIIMEDFSTYRAEFEETVNYVLENDLREIDLANKNNLKEPLKTLSNLHYLSLHKDDGFIFISRYSSFGFEVGIVYSSTNKEPEGPYFSDVKVLDENWFLFKSK